MRRAPLTCALAVLAAKKNVRVLLTGALADPSAPDLLVRPVAGGFLLRARLSTAPGRLSHHIQKTVRPVVIKRR